MDHVSVTPVSRGKLIKIKDEVQFTNWQVEGIRQMALMGSLLLCDEMGLGKTLEALTVAAIDFERGTAKRVLVVAPASLKWNWEAEIEKHTHFTCEVLEGTKPKREKQISEFDKDILIVNYEQLLPHAAQLNDLEFSIVIYDEAHYMKSHKAKRTRACMQLKADRHLLLTGSPLLNQVNDLWALLYRVCPSEYPKYYAFLNRYAVFGGFKDKEIIGVKHEVELKDRLKTLMIRRLAKDTLGLDEPTIIPVPVELHPEQRKLYKQAVEELKIDVPGEPDPWELDNALVKFTRLKAICGTTAAIPGMEDHSYKLDRAVEMIRELIDSGERVVVFTQSRPVMSCMERRLSALPKPIEFYSLHGDVPVKDRVALVEKQWAVDQPKVLLAMLQVGGTGLNMVAACKCIFLDKLFVPKLNEQAIARLQRKGQTKPVTVWQLIAKNTIEQRIETILKRKVKVFDTLVEDTAWKRKLWAALREAEEDGS